ncbi:MAG: ABC transporter ATP-binding protein, partial [Candidatus Omnitrophota bacterium]
MSVITIHNLWEKYRIKFIREGKVAWEETWALEDVNLQVEQGEVLGVIGQNGAGKTTLLKLIAGMLIPDKGEIKVGGRVSVLMELGAGFNPELTGRENILFNAKMYGLHEAAMEERMTDIIAFAGLGKFIEAPIKYYSQGMFARLAFSLAIFVEPDVLLIDDILAVGDEDAHQKCINKVWELKQSGKTIILVSHDMNMVKKLCDRVILLEKSRVIQAGPPAKVIPYYLESIGDKKGIAILEKESLRVVFNNGRVFISYKGIPLTAEEGGRVSFFLPGIKVWSSSINLSWEVKSFTSDNIIAEGKFPEGTVAQLWDFRLEKDSLRWQVKPKEQTVEEPHIDLPVVSQYKRWDTAEGGKEFPAFSSKSEWQDLGLRGNPDGILGISGDLAAPDLPGIILEQKENGRPFNPDFAIGFEENGLTSCQDKACEQKNHSRIQCNTARTLLRAQRSHGKKLETFYQNPIANSGFKLFNTGYAQDARVVQQVL